MSDAVLAIAAELSVEAVLQRLVDSRARARRRALRRDRRARRRGRVRLLHHLGHERRARRRDGPAPAHARNARRDARVRPPAPDEDIRQDPRFRGWWPRAHPQMRSFLGVPIVSRGGIIGAFYLTDKVGADAFDEADQHLIEMLAAHAAIAIENARLLRAQPRAQRSSRSATASRASCTTRSRSTCSASCSPRRAPRRLLDRDPATARAQLDARPGAGPRRRWRSCAR